MTEELGAEARIAALERELAALRAEVAGLRGAGPSDHDRRLDRRDLLHKAALGAAGAVVGFGAAARPAAAADGANIVIGTTSQTAQTTTQLRYDQAAIAEEATDEVDVFTVHDGSSPIVSEHPAALGGAATGPYRNGVYGRTTSSLGAGVVGRSFAENGVGVIGTAMLGGLVGVRGTAGGGTSGIGVQGLSTGTDSGSGVTGIAQGIRGRGIAGAASGQQGVGVQAIGTAANLALDPFGPAAPTYGEVGWVRVDGSGDLWLCITGGDPGVWRKVSGPSTAGSLHALPAPARVFDSRSGGGGGPIQSGQNRVVSLATAVPAGATAALVNLTIDATVASGFLAVASAAVAAGAMVHSNTNWFGSGQIHPATTLTAVDSSRQVRVKCGGGGSAQFLVDVLAYYR